MHPTNPDLVYVAAFGHSSKDNPERGLYRSKDGGETWELVLHVSERAGAVDVALDPNNPRILFATIWQARRTFWSIDAGGPDSGLWRSRDGGDTWENISTKQGMPEGTLGKIGVSVSPARPGRVFAIVEAEGRTRGPLPIRRPRRDVGAGVGQARVAVAALVLHARHRRPHRRRHGVRHEHEGLEVDRRWQERSRSCTRPTVTTTRSGSIPRIRTG